MPAASPKLIGNVQLDYRGPRDWLVLSSFGFYLPSLDAIVMIQPGYRTDGGSVPLWRLALARAGVLLLSVVSVASVLRFFGLACALAGIAMLAIERNGRMLPAFILHDLLTGTGRANGKPISFLQAIRALGEAGQACGACRLERWIVCSGLIFGWFYWHSLREKEKWDAAEAEGWTLCKSCQGYGHDCPHPPSADAVVSCADWKPAP